MPRHTLIELRLPEYTPDIFDSYANPKLEVFGYLFGDQEALKFARKLNIKVPSLRDTPRIGKAREIASERLKMFKDSYSIVYRDGDSGPTAFCYRIGSNKDERDLRLCKDKDHIRRFQRRLCLPQHQAPVWYTCKQY